MLRHAALMAHARLPDMQDADTLRRFIFEHAPVRGEIVRLNATWRAVLERHDYPPVVRETLGEYLAAAALLSGTIKYDGSLIMQIRGTGPITTLVAECTSRRTVRGLARWQGQVAPGSLSELTGAGNVVITIDPGADMERYQGIVSLEGDDIAQALGHYLEQSEQLKTQLWLVANENLAVGMLLQKLPDSAAHAGQDEDLWNRVQQLASTVTPEELLTLTPAELLRRLFNEEDLRVFEAEPMSFRCTCSRERVRNMLRALGPDEVHDIIKEQGAVSITCEYCNQKYQFDPVDAEQIFAAEVSPQVPSTKH
jgi:molecular chaperone Hsp33